MNSYQEGEDSRANSQVRRIIDKINQERPSVESERKVVFREDGSKAVRVVKRRRVTKTPQEKNRSSRIRFFIALFSMLLIGAIAAVYFAIRLSMMSSSQYLESKKDELQAALQADAIVMTGAQMNGFSLRIGEIRCLYATGSSLKEVQLKNIAGNIDSFGIFFGRLDVDELSVASAKVVMRRGVNPVAFQGADVSDFLRFKRLNCSNLSLYVDRLKSSPLAITQAEAYLYFPQATRDKMTISINSGFLQVLNWKRFEIRDLRGYLSKDGISELSAELIENEGVSRTLSTSAPSLTLRTSLKNGANIYGPYSFISNRIPFADLSANRITSFFKAETREPSAAIKSAGLPSIVFSADGKKPSVKGVISLQDVRWYALPALNVLMKHVPSDKRARYISLKFPRAQVLLDSSPTGLHMSFEAKHMTELNTVELSGVIDVNEENDLTGNLLYGMPAALTRAEYPDGLSDPVFKEEGTLALLSTTLSGTALAPNDNGFELEAAVANERAKRPEPKSLEAINVDILSEQMRQQRETRHSSDAEALPAAKTESENP